MLKSILAICLFSTLAFSVDILTSYKATDLYGCFKITSSNEAKHTFLAIRNDKGSIVVIDSLKTRGYERYQTSLLEIEESSYIKNIFFTAYSEDHSLDIWRNKNNQFHAVYSKNGKKVELECSSDKQVVGSIYLDLILN